MMVFLNIRHCESIPEKNFIGRSPQKFSPANLSSFTVVSYYSPISMIILWLVVSVIILVDSYVDFPDVVQ